MKLVDPTDFDVLEVFEDGRNVATNVADELGHDRAYLNTRLPHLQDHGLLEKVGPAANSGLYELTDRGQAALGARDQYDDVGPDGFAALVEDA